MVNIKTDTKYRILNFETGTYLSISENDNVSIVGNPYDENKKELQEWNFEPLEGTDLYFIRPPYSNNYVTVNPAGVDLQGKQVICDSQPLAGAWKVLSAPHTGTAVKIAPLFGSYFIDIKDTYTVHGAAIQLWGSEDSNTQIWVLEEIRDEPHQHNRGPDTDEE